MEKLDLQKYRELVDEQRERFKSMTLPPEFAELFETNTLQLLVKMARYKSSEFCRGIRG